MECRLVRNRHLADGNFRAPPIVCANFQPLDAGDDRGAAASLKLNRQAASQTEHGKKRFSSHPTRRLSVLGISELTLLHEGQLPAFLQETLAGGRHSRLEKGTLDEISSLVTAPHRSAHRRIPTQRGDPGVSCSGSLAPWWRLV